MRGNKIFRWIDRYIGIPLLSIFSLGKVLHGAQSPPKPERILVIKFSALGDSILIVPAIRSLRNKFPGAEIIFLGTNLTLPFLRQFPEYISEFVALDIGSLLKHPMSAIAFVRRLRRMKCDAVVDLEQWLRLSALIALISGAPQRFGFRTNNAHRHFGYTRSTVRNSSKHEIENFLAVAELLTGTSSENHLEIKVDEGSLMRGQSFLLNHGWQKGTSVVIIHPGCGAHGYPREWPPRKYGELLSRLAGTGEYMFIISGTSDERDAMVAVTQSTGVNACTYEISSLEDIIALLSLSRFLVSSNNGAMHLAAALRLPQIALHGPTNAVQWGPKNPNATVITSDCPWCPCLDLGFEYHRTDGFCMDQISVDEVVNAAIKLKGGIS